MRIISRLARAALIGAWLAPMPSFAANCEVRIADKINLKTEFARKPLLLRDQTLVIGRQNEGSYFFIKPDGRINNYNLGSYPTQGSPAELSDGTVVAASTDGRLHFLDSDGKESRSIAAARGRYIWYAADLANGTFAAFANRRAPGFDKPLGSVHFMSYDGSPKAVTDLGLDAIGSEPLILPDRTIVLKTQASNVMLLTPDGVRKSEPVFGGARASQVLDHLEDGTILTGGDFGDSRKILFLSPSDGSILSELRFGIENQGIRQDILFLHALRDGNVAVGFTEYEQTPQGPGYHERLEIFGRDGTSYGEFHAKNVGFNVDWNVTELSDGTIVHGAGNSVYFLSETASEIARIDLSEFVNGAPIALANGSVAVVTGKTVDDFKVNTLYFLKKECGLARR